MALLNSTYKSPQANILFGAGNSSITDQQIKDFISTPGRTDDEIKGAALNYNINVNQISRAMAGHQAYSPERLEGYLKGQGITKETAIPQVIDQPPGITYQPAAAPPQVNPTPITIDPTKDTVAGQMGSLISDSNNPLNVQAQTFGNQQANRRGLLNSSIATSAAQDAMYKNLMPIATQDAGTYYDSKRTNAAQGLQAGMFNADLGSRVGMFNADQGLRAGMFNNEMARDYANINKDYFTSTLDANTRMNVANMQVRSAETGIMGDLSKNYMDLYARIAADANMSPDAKKEAVSNLQSQYSASIGLMDTFAGAAKKIAATFSGDGSGSGVSSDGGSSVASGEVVTQRSDGATATPGSDGKVGSIGSVIPNKSGAGYTVYMAGVGTTDLKPVAVDTSSFRLSAQEVTSVSNYNSRYGTNLDTNDIVPSEFLSVLQTQAEQYGFRENTIDKFAVPLQPEGTMRADSPLFYIWKAALPKYQK